MTEFTETQLIGDIARDLVTQIAPEELPLFRPIREAYFKDPKKTLKGQAGKDEMLGFGVGDAAILITPIVLGVATDVVKYIGEQLLQTIKQEGATLATEALKKLFKKFRTPAENEEETLALGAEQITTIRQLAFERARQLKLPEAQAENLADSIADSLVVTKS
ncbi:MAG: hypothetical protein MN733_21785 [Nitrososphaera sp.]|nr:hypothetical protein [Nitrososphaera sp.]